MQLTYITKQQTLNSGQGWSIYSGQRWSRPLVFPISDYFGYYFLDIACHEFAIGKTFKFSARLKCFEQNPIEIYGVQNAVMEMEDIKEELYDFEVDKTNYKKFKKQLDRVMNDMICFDFMVTSVIDQNHTQGKILSFK